MSKNINSNNATSISDLLDVLKIYEKRWFELMSKSAVPNYDHRIAYYEEQICEAEDGMLRIAKALTQLMLMEQETVMKSELSVPELERKILNTYLISDAYIDSDISYCSKRTWAVISDLNTMVLEYREYLQVRCNAKINCLIKK